jgi:hypothetical protein
MADPWVAERSVDFKMPAARTNGETPPAATTQHHSPGRKNWVKLTPRDHVLRQIDIQRELVESLRTQLQKEEQTLQGMDKAKKTFPAE